MRRRLSLLVVAVMLVVTACGGGNGNTADKSNTGSPSDVKPAEPAPSNQPIELGITWWGPDARHEATLAATEIYSRQFPNVSFKPEYMAWDAFWQKLPTL